MNSTLMTRMAMLACLLAFIVVTLGAYTRLSEAGLGCPDWPGCYGHVIVPNAHQAATVFPNTPIESGKAWKEMIHRYAAGSLGLVILFLWSQSVRRRRQAPAFLKITSVLVLLVCFQAALGMWTVTLKLLPLVVMGHLLGGMSIIACLWWMVLMDQPVIANHPNGLRYAVLGGIVLLVIQITLGGWVSSNYAGLACIGFPRCNGMWFPTLHTTKNAFTLLSPIGANYQGGLLGSDSRAAIQMIHRLWAFVTVTYMLGLVMVLFRQITATRVRRLGVFVLGCLGLQFSLGILNVVWMLPMPIAVAHNGVAALLLLSCLSLFDAVKREERVTE